MADLVGDVILHKEQVLGDTWTNDEYALKN